MGSEAKGLQRPVKGIIKCNNVSEITLIGDPGCDGLGAEIMTVYANALDEAEGELVIILGDMVPFGSHQVYKKWSDFTDGLATRPVYTLKGNHDTDYYDEYFGSPNYALDCRDLLLIVLDNTGRAFTAEALDFAAEAMEKSDAPDIALLFHYPPPNPQASNSINPPQWDDFRKVYAPHRDRIRYFVAGHVHSRAECEIDGIPVIISGGGGARIEGLNGEKDDGYVKNHIVSLKKENKCWGHSIVNLNQRRYESEIADETLKGMLEKSLSGEVMAHFKYRLMAFKAEEQGWEGTAALFRALSDSEFRHAAAHYSVLGLNGDLKDDLEESIKGEGFEVDVMYEEYRRYARENNHSLATYSFNDAREAEMVHKGMLEEARSYLNEEKDLPRKSYYICSSCGYTFETEKAPGRCPVCGAPGDKILKSS